MAPGELFPRVGFIVTNLGLLSDEDTSIVSLAPSLIFGSRQWICPKANTVPTELDPAVGHRKVLSLFILAYNLGNFLRRLRIA